MYFPFLQNDYNSYFYYCLNTFDIEPQSAEKPFECLQQPTSPTGVLKIEEKDAEDIESYIADNISISVKDLRDAGYEKKKQPWSEEEDCKLVSLVNKKLKWIQIAE